MTVWVAVICLILDGIIYLFPGLFQSWELKTLDIRFLARFWLNNNPEISDRLVQVNVDNHAFEFTGGNLWRRGTYGEALKTISFAGARVVGADIVFSGVTDSLEDSRLISSLERAEVVVTPLLFRTGKNPEENGFNFKRLRDYYIRAEPDDYPDIPGSGDILRITGISTPPLAEVLEKSLAAGYVNMFFDPDGVIRRYPLIMNIEGKAFPSFALSLACEYFRCPFSEVEINPGHSIVLPGVKLNENEPVRDITIPIDSHGSILVNYVGAWEEGFDNIYSAGDILEYADNPGLLYPQLGDKLVILAEFSDRTGDRGNIPLEANYPRSGVYTTILNSIFTGQYLRQAGGGVIFPISIVFTAVILGLSFFVSMTVFTIAYLMLLTAYIALCFGLFTYGGYILPVVSPSALSAGLFLAAASAKFHFQEQYRLFLESKFKCYLSPAILRKIREDPGLVATGGEKRNLVVFFADIRKFSRLSESLEPRELVAFTNRYYSLMVDVALKYDGTVDKYTGDEVMIYFGAPYAHDDDHLRALKMTREMVEKLDEFNRRVISEGYEPIRIGIGINYGPVVVGNIGSEKRMDYSVMGDVINKGARIVASAGAGEIKISESYLQLVENYVNVERMEPFSGKEGETPIQTYLLREVTNL